MPAPLPPGQRETPNFPRFGLLPFATRFPSQTGRINLHVSFPDSGATANVPGPAPEPTPSLSSDVGAHLAQLPRIEQTSDFHCVTTWTRRGLRWGGVRFSDFYQQIIAPLCQPGAANASAGAPRAHSPAAGASFVVLRAQDGARTSLPLEDLLSPDVLLADHLDGQPLSIEHGAPLRLIAPAHYGYKSKMRRQAPAPHRILAQRRTPH